VDAASMSWADDALTPRADPDGIRLDRPVLVVSGRQDTWVGWERQERMATQYPRAEVVTLDGAGHALPHECPDDLGRLLTGWLERSLAE